MTVDEDPFEEDGVSILAPPESEEAVAKAESATASWGELLRLAAPERKWIGLGCLTLLLRLPFSLASPHFQAEALGAAIRGDERSLARCVVLLVVCGAVNALLDFWNVFFFDFAKARLLRRLRTRLFAKLLSMEMAFFDASVSGWLSSRLAADTAEMGNDLTWVFRWSIEAGVRIGGIVAYMFVREWHLALLCVAIVPPITLINFLYGAWLRTNAARVQGRLADAGGLANEALAAARTVLCCAAEPLERRRYETHIDRHYALTVKQAVAQASYYMLCYSLLVGTAVPAALLWYGGKRVMHSTPPSVLIAFMLYQSQLLEYTGQLLNSVTSLLKSSGSGGEVFKLLRRMPQTPQAAYAAPPPPSDPSRDDEPRQRRRRRPPPPPPPPPPPRGDNNSNNPSDGLLEAPLLLGGESDEALLNKMRPRGLVELSDVRFAYATRPLDSALNGVSLVARPGEFTALVGASGAGKSTVFALVYALYTPSAGTVTLDGRPVASLPTPWLRAQALGVVTQEPVLISGTIAENILYCRRARRAANAWEDEDNNIEDEADDLRVAQEAAKATFSHDFIDDLPLKYLTPVGESGKHLSGGQKQRIAIARAIAHDPAVLLLDEATSALDAKSEEAVRRALRSATAGRTTLAIAHRLSSVRHADNIYVLHQGTVVEAGRHADLLAKRGHYANLVNRQLLDES